MLQPPFNNAFKADVLDLAPIIIAVHDTDHNIIWANKAYQRATGLTLKEIEGKKCFSIWRLSYPCRGCPVLTAIETGKEEEAELTPENQDHWPTSQGSWLVKAVPLRDSSGSIMGAIEAAYEITARRQLEKMLQESEEEKSAILDSMSELVAYQGLDHTVLWTNKAAAESVDEKPENLVGRKCYEIWANRKEECEICPVAKAIETGGIHQNITTTPDKRVWIVTGHPVKNQNGEIIGTVEVTTDITDRKRAEDVLYRSQKMLARTESITHIGSWEWEIATDTVTWSEELFRIFQLDPDDRALSWAEHPKLYHPEDFEILRQAVEVAATNGTPYEIELRAFRKDGETRVCQARGFAELGKNGKPVYLFGSLHDITEKRLAEEALIESEANYKALIDNINIGVAVYEAKDDGKDFTFVDFNKAGERIEQIKREQVIGKSVTKIFPDIKQFGLLEVLKRVWKTGKSERHPITFYKDERISGWRDNYVYKLPSGEIVSAYSDETERKQREKALREAYSIINRSPAVVFLWKNSEGWPVEFVSDNVKVLFGYTAEEFISGKVSYATTVHPDDLDRVVQEVAEYSEEEGREDFVHKPYRIFTKDGETKWLNDMTFIRRNEKGDITHYQGIVVDITERKRLEEELLRAQKLESVGTLAGGIAHDFNNILATILGNVSLARIQVNPESELFEILREAEKASVRARTLTKQLLTFAKGGVPVKEIALIKDVIEDSSLFVLRGSKSGCEFSISEDLWATDVDVGQISQVINNIVINANQAMPEGGIIQVAAENLIIEARHGLPVNPGRYIRISIKDQGVGITKEHIANIFDPYFTTKQKGSGLGLATTYSIIKKHNGHIAVESQSGIGTTFYIYLPASDEAVPEKEEVKLIKGHGRILVMDDEVALRKMVGRMLEKLGYESEFAKDGAEAIQMVKEAKEAEKPYDAVILDLTIPGAMGGKEAINKLLEIDPEVKAIVSSGYSDDPVLANFQEYGFKGMMPKPFESQLLSKVLHEVLRGEKE